MRNRIYVRDSKNRVKNYEAWEQITVTVDPLNHDDVYTLVDQVQARLAENEHFTLQHYEWDGDSVTFWMHRWGTGSNNLDMIRQIQRAARSLGIQLYPTAECVDLFSGKTRDVALDPKIDCIRRATNTELLQRVAPHPTAPPDIVAPDEDEEAELHDMIREDIEAVAVLASQLMAEVDGLVHKYLWGQPES